VRAGPDVNVYVSAFINPAGSPGRVLAGGHDGRVTLCISEGIMADLAGVLTRPHVVRALGWPTGAVADALRNLRDLALMVEPAIVQAVATDPDDDVVLGTAIAAYADDVISGDRHPLDLGVYRDIQIVTPRQFVAMLDGAP